MPLPQSSHRKSHRKSRHGCLLCKKRHVKCDEDKPACGNCIKFSSACEYPDERRGIASDQKLGRPRKVWTSEGQSMSSSSSPHNPPDSEQHAYPLSIGDLELLHHWTTCTYLTLADGSIAAMWRDNIPRLGFTYPFVLRLTLAMAARHLQRLQPQSNRGRYVNLAEQHFTIALAEVLLLLPSLDSQNCQALYISSVLICLYFFARGPAPGEYLMFGEDGPSQFLPLLRGVRTIMQTLDGDVVFSGSLAPMHAGNCPKEAEISTAEREDLPKVKWQEPIQKLRLFIASSEDREAVEICLPALDALSAHFEATYGRDDGSYQGEVHNQIVLRWIYCLDGKFIEYLQQKHPIALLICAHFALIMKVLDHQNCWFMHGWAEHILVGIHRTLEPEYHVWLLWSMEQAGLAHQAEQVQHSEIA